MDNLENHIQWATEMLMAITTELNYTFGPDGFSDDEEGDGMDVDNEGFYVRDMHIMNLAVLFPPPASPTRWDAANPEIHANTERWARLW